MCVYPHTSLYFKLYMIFFSIPVSSWVPPRSLPPSLFCFFWIYTSLSVCLTKIQFQAFLCAKTMTKWFYSRFWKWLNLTTIVFCDNLCFHVLGLLLDQHFFFFWPQIWTISYLCLGWKQIPSPGMHLNGEEHASLKSPELQHLPL